MGRSEHNNLKSVGDGGRAWKKAQDLTVLPFIGSSAEVQYRSVHIPLNCMSFKFLLLKDKHTLVMAGGHPIS